VRNKYKGEARASIDSFMHVYNLDILLLARGPISWGF
jgi:hypothetical protein